MSALEGSLYEIAQIFLIPVLLLILASLAYSFMLLGGFAVEVWQRRSPTFRSSFFAQAIKSGMASDDLELDILKRLEWPRVVSRSAPMLGLVATMIPMGPALLALSENDTANVGRNLVVAFSAVILALISASICFFVMTVRRRWMLQELRLVEKDRGARHAVS
ncbi:MotA/TolQ/ExbB proton channel family protein [Parvibaculum sp.]|jgi:hypothetical protein|uniref:MotA/TolQ/ExbB proton channel family protein n=1 Tax=Parvibaculum sp. TaxID=2024848 RepID=UPI000C5F7AA9|nr:MotA/TolQ/ExbB proton channel family protein [Parvibaculum sp.]MAM95252.1 biopolymer transporter ExbD [Parvibaculum sp.]|tara:strand:+ start:15387 stop:15875 length:489 start_codon:yes stop_codon:yes gene_type:complete